MDHAEALELIAQAAAEPAALRALSTGADPSGRALREHLAGCEPCMRECLAWLHLAEAVSGTVIEKEPVERVPTGLKDATLALVQASGSVRASGAAPAADRPIGPGPLPSAPLMPDTTSTHRRVRWSWPALAGLAAVVAIVALAGTLAATRDLNRQLQAARSDQVELTRVAATVDRLMQAQDHRVVILERADGTGAGGSVIWSPASGTLVVLSQTLAAPPAGMTYRCWVAHQGARQPVGEMHIQGSLAYWAGPLSQWGGTIQPGDQFGVSLVPATGGSPGEPVLEGGV